LFPESCFKNRLYVSLLSSLHEITSMIKFRMELIRKRGQSPFMQGNPARLLLLSIGLIAHHGVHAATEPLDVPRSIISRSPDGIFQLCRMQADPGERGEARKILEITGRNGKILYQWSSPLGATTALWSRDFGHLAVNDAPGDRGDQLRVFALDGANQRVTPLREPDGAKLRSEVESRHGGFFSALERVTLRSLEWKEDRLWCQVTGTFSPKRQRGIHVPFHYLWIFKVHGEEAPVLQEEWTRTDPKERPVRDPVE